MPRKTSAKKRSAVSYRRRYVRGRGDYSTALVPYNPSVASANSHVPRKPRSKWLASALGAAGRAGGSMIPFAGGALGPVLGTAGEWLGQKIKDWTGLGGYRISKNVLLEANDPPGVSNKPALHGTTFRHREYITDIVSSSSAGAFQVQGFAINPGQVATFPWLASMASNFEEYKLEGVLFEYRTMSADALSSTNTALGQVILMTQYNANNPAPTSKQQMENYEYAQSIKPSQSCIHPIECDPKQTALSDKLYVRGGSVPSGQDVKTYDWGNFYVATNGMQGASVNCGELWVTYQVTFFKPRLYASLGYGTNIFRQSVNTSTNTIDASHPLGTNLTTGNSGSTMVGCSMQAATLTLPASSPIGTVYMIHVIYVSYSGTYSLSNPTAYTNCAVYYMFNGDANGVLIWPQNGNANTQGGYDIAVKVTAPNPSITFPTSNTFAGGASLLDVIVIEVPPNISTIP